MNKTSPVILLCFLCSVFGIAQHQKLDSIIPTIQSPKDSIAFDAANGEIKQLWLQEKFDLVLSYEDKLLNLGREIEYHKGLGDLHLFIGNVYNSTHKNDKAYEYYDKAIVYYELVNNERAIAIINNNKSTIEQGKGNVEGAIDYIHKANLYFEKMKDTLVLSSTYNNLANIYSDAGNHDKAEEFYLKSIEIKRNTNSPKLSSSLNNLALLYIDIGKIDKAEPLLVESLQVAERHQNSYYKTLAYHRLGTIYLERKVYDKSKKYFDSSLTQAVKSQNAKLVANAKLQLGVVATANENYFKAEKLLQESRETLEELETAPLLLTNYWHLADLNFKKGNYKDAFLWQKKYQQLSDDNVAKENADNIAKAEQKYKSDLEKQKQIDEQEKRELLAKQELFVYKIFTVISLIIAATFLGFLLYVIRSRREKKKYIKQLNESNQIKNKLFSIISHDLKNEIHGLEGSLNLLKDDFISSEEFKEIVPLLANRTHQTSILLNNLLNWSKSQMKELSANPIGLTINSVITEKFKFFEPKANEKELKLVNQLDQDTMVFVDKDMFSIVSQNLIANAIKFCNPNDTITLTSIDKDEHVQIRFEDSGVGIAPENLHKLFAEETFTTTGTQKEKGTGLGLRICKELVELNHGNISVQSELGKGTTFIISLPKNIAA